MKLGGLATHESVPLSEADREGVQNASDTAVLTEGVKSDAEQTDSMRSASSRNLGSNPVFEAE